MIDAMYLGDPLEQDRLRLGLRRGDGGHPTRRASTAPAKRSLRTTCTSESYVGRELIRSRPAPVSPHRETKRASPPLAQDDHQRTRRWGWPDPSSEICARGDVPLDSASPHPGSTFHVPPSTLTRIPVRSRAVASPQPTTAGIPYSRAMIEACEAGLPTSVTTAAARAKRTRPRPVQ